MSALNLPAIIRKARLTAGLSQTQVARAIGCQRKRVTDLESGRVRLPADDLLKLAKLLGIDLNELKSKPNEIIKHQTTN